MTTKTKTGERLAVIEEQLKQNKHEHIELKKLVEVINSKLDKYIKEVYHKIDTKADKDYVDKIKIEVKKDLKTNTDNDNQFKNNLPTWIMMGITILISAISIYVQLK